MNTYEVIKALRLQLNISQDELARRTGYTDRSSIAKIEAGKVDLTESKILLFAKALGVSPAELMGITPVVQQHDTLTPDESQLITDYRDASEEIREEAGAMLHRSAERNRRSSSETGRTVG